jgi:hypothetical protein
MSAHAKTLTSLRLGVPNKYTQSVILGLKLQANGHEELIDVAVSCDGLMYLMTTLQEYQVRHKLHIPWIARPKGKPSLSIVAEDP